MYRYRRLILFTIIILAVGWVMLTFGLAFLQALQGGHP